MAGKFPEYKNFNLSDINREILDKWLQEKTFERSIEIREGNPEFIFYEGPPSANGMPGIHHVISRAIKDIFCRYKTQKGFHVKRKAGWDTHGLPVELGVEKMLGITKEDIGRKISISEYNAACKKEVMKYTDAWEDLTHKMGYWIDMEHPYITYDNRYIETLWYLLKVIYDKGLLYKGYSIQPYSPAAGTGLSNNELNFPGCYRDVKDTTCVAQFKVIRDDHSEFLYHELDTELFILAWTTTPWTLPSNTALAVGDNIQYLLIRTFNPYSGDPVTVILAKDLKETYFPAKNEEMPLEVYEPGNKDIPYRVLEEVSGKELEGLRYEQLIPWVKPRGDAFRVVTGDFVSTEEGTGIVHIAPTFGADDQRMSVIHNIAPMLVVDKAGVEGPLVDRNGRFFPLENLDDSYINNYVNVENYKPFAGRFVKNEYDESMGENDATVDIDIAVMLKKENKAFRIEKHVHNYPHCWRTDKPVLYYPLDSWFIKTTVVKEQFSELNKTINWKPESTGTGRFGKWLENLVDWNLSRSRFWGTPLPVWVSEDKSEKKCIGSVQELKEEVEKAIAAGFMKENPFGKYREGVFTDDNYNSFDLHRPFIDDVVMVSPSGKKMFREPDLIDVWFDSGSMPYAQVHYPFENKERFEKSFPADFIAEGVDQTRGWFFTLHAIAVMVSGSVAFKNIVSNGLVLDKNGNKMSKRLGNAVDPFETIEEHGSDPVRWYMITNAQPWDNLKFDISGVDEVKRKFFGTLYNTYSFFALYANVDGFKATEPMVPLEQRPEIDRWIISLLNTLVKDVDDFYSDYEPTRAGRAIQEFVIENLSNWYVRLNRKRFWGGEFSGDKLAAYQTLWTCLVTVAQLIAPLAPFFADKLFLDLQVNPEDKEKQSVHLSDFPEAEKTAIDPNLEERMWLAQEISSMILGLRRKVNIKVRQPLGRMMIPVTDKKQREQLEAVKKLILTEVNVKEMEYIDDTSGILVKKVKPDFKKLGPRYGKLMKIIAGKLAGLEQDEINQFEKTGKYEFSAGEDEIVILIDDVEIISEDIPGWLVANQGKLTVALDIQVSDELKREGIARELINRIQNLRKESGLDVTDKIVVNIKNHPFISDAIEEHHDYIAAQTLAKKVELIPNVNGDQYKKIELDEETITYINITKVE